MVSVLFRDPCLLPEDGKCGPTSLLYEQHLGWSTWGCSPSGFTLVLGTLQGSCTAGKVALRTCDLSCSSEHHCQIVQAVCGLVGEISHEWSQYFTKPQPIRFASYRKAALHGGMESSGFSLSLLPSRVMTEHAFQPVS